MVVGAVAFGENPPFYKDSKAITAAARERFAEEIQSDALYCELGWVWPEEIDELGLTDATTAAIMRALESAPPDAKVLLDGSVNFLKNEREGVTWEPRADERYSHVAAASIIAKVARDRYMRELALTYPEYGFDTHVGYGVKAHADALKLLKKVTPHHRKSFKPVQMYV